MSDMECFKPNDAPYPLCVGDKDKIEFCKHCCLYEDMEEDMFKGVI